MAPETVVLTRRGKMYLVVDLLHRLQKYFVLVCRTPNLHMTVEIMSPKSGGWLRAVNVDYCYLASFDTVRKKHLEMVKSERTVQRDSLASAISDQSSTHVRT